MQVFDEEFVQKSYKRWGEGVDKDFAQLVQNFTTKGLYARTVLHPKVRELCAISALTVTNALPQLGTHIKYAFRAGATEAEVKEAIIQMATYCGMPYVGQAFEKYKETVKEIGKGG